MGVDPTDAYQRAAACFGETISALADDEWDRASYPDGWTVLTSVAWVVVGDAQVPGLVSGESWSPTRDFDAGVLGTNPVATWRGTALAAIAALRTPGALDGTFHHPDGLVAVADLVTQRVTENLTRAWDVGEAVGRPVAIPAALAEWCLDRWAGHGDALMSGHVLPDKPIEPPPEADAAVRLLALTGRRVADG